MTNWTIPNRFYNPINQRQQAIDRIINTEQELKTAITMAASKSQPLNVRLGANLIITATITIPATVDGFQLNGGNAYGIKFSGALSSVFSVPGNRVLFLDTFITANTASDTATNAFTHSLASASLGINMRNVKIQDVTNLIDPNKQWANGSMVNCVIGEEFDFPTPTPVYFRDTAGVGAISNFSLLDCRGCFAVDLNSGSAKCRFVCCGLEGNPGTVDTTGGITVTATNRHEFIACSFASFTVRDGDVVLPGLVTETTPLTRLAGGIATRSRAVSLTDTDPTLDPLGATFIRLSVGGLASGNVTIADGQNDGQHLIIQATSVSGSVTFPDSTSQNMRLSASWTPAIHDTLTLIWNEDDGNWVELARSNN